MVTGDLSVSPVQLQLGAGALFSTEQGTKCTGLVISTFSRAKDAQV